MPSVKRGTKQVALSDEEQLGVRLKRAREDAGLGQVEVSHELRVHSVTVSRWETGKNSPDAASLARMADLYGTTVQALMGGSSHGAPGGQVNEGDGSHPLGTRDAIEGMLYAVGRMSSLIAELVAEAQKHRAGATVNHYSRAPGERLVSPRPRAARATG